MSQDMIDTYNEAGSSIGGNDRGDRDANVDDFVLSDDSENQVEFGT